MRRWIFLILKLAIAAGLITYVVLSGMLEPRRLALLSRAPGWVALALLALSVQLFFNALRTRRLLFAHGDAPALWTIVKLTYLGAFFDLFAIVSVGGDAVKAWYLAHEIPLGRRTEAVSALVVDRLLGLLGLLALTLAAMGWRFDAMWSDAALRPYVLGLLAVCAGLGVGTFMLFSRRVHDWAPLRWVLQRLPFGKTVDRAYASMQAFRDAPRILFEGWLLSLGVHLMSSTSFYCLAMGLKMYNDADGFDAGLFFAALLIGNFVCSFASFGAVGVGQAAFAFGFERIARLSGGADLATAGQVAFFLVKSPGLLAWLTAKKRT